MYTKKEIVKQLNNYFRDLNYNSDFLNISQMNLFLNSFISDNKIFIRFSSLKDYIYNIGEIDLWEYLIEAMDDLKFCDCEQKIIYFESISTGDKYDTHKILWDVNNHTLRLVKNG